MTQCYKEFDVAERLQPSRRGFDEHTQCLILANLAFSARLTKIIADNLSCHDHTCKCIGHFTPCMAQHETAGHIKLLRPVVFLIEMQLMLSSACHCRCLWQLAVHVASCVDIGSLAPHTWVLGQPGRPPASSTCSQSNANQQCLTYMTSIGMDYGQPAACCAIDFDIRLNNSAAIPLSTI